MEAVRDRPRDMFTASGGTEGTNMCVVTLRAEESMYSLGRVHSTLGDKEV